MYNISIFSKTGDYLPIVTSALIVDMVIISMVITGHIKIKALNEWYKRFGFLAVLADVLSIVIGIIISRLIYSWLFKDYVLVYFLILTCIIQLLHDITFAKIFYSVPRKRSEILDVFKDYANEVGKKILYADGLMMISTVLLASIMATYSVNIIIIIMIISLYILPYLVYSIK